MHKPLTYDASDPAIGHQPPGLALPTLGEAQLLGWDPAIAKSKGISQSAVSQHLQRHGALALLGSTEVLR